MRPRSFPRPSHPLPASLLGQQRGLGKLDPFSSRPHFGSADVKRGFGLCPAIVCAGGGEGLGPGPPRTPAAPGTPWGRLFQPPTCPLTLLRGLRRRIRSWGRLEPQWGQVLPPEVILRNPRISQA